jgi:hypothetical protein
METLSRIAMILICLGALGSVGASSIHVANFVSPVWPRRRNPGSLVIAYQWFITSALLLWWAFHLGWVHWVPGIFLAVLVLTGMLGAVSAGYSRVRP